MYLRLVHRASTVCLMLVGFFAGALVGSEPIQRANARLREDTQGCTITAERHMQQGFIGRTPAMASELGRDQ